MTTSSSNSSGIGFFGLLAVLFIGLKLAGYITWSWIWVLSPLWIPVVFGLTLFCIISGIIIIIEAIRHHNQTKRLRK